MASDKIKRPKATRAISLHWRLHNGVMTSVVRWPLRPAFCCNHKVWHCPFWARSSRLNTGWNINKFGWKLRGSSQLTEGAWARAELEKIMRACSHAHSCCKWMARSAIDMNIVALTQALQPPLSPTSTGRGFLKYAKRTSLSKNLLTYFWIQSAFSV